MRYKELRNGYGVHTDYEVWVQHAHIRQLSILLMA